MIVMMMTIDHGDDQDDDDIEDDDDNDNDDDDDNHNNDDDEDGNGDYDDNDDDNDDASKFYIYIPWVFSKVNCVFIRLLNVKALICAFNKNKALIGAYSLIVKSLRTFVSCSNVYCSSSIKFGHMGVRQAVSHVLKFHTTST